LWAGAVEEILRHRGPVQGTKPGWATEDIELHGVTIPKGKPVMPLFGAANHDPRAFEKPDEFDVAGSPNQHLGLGLGRHFCMGRQLALMETRVALKNLIGRNPDLQLAVDPSDLEIQPVAAWHRHASLPVRLG
jgi:cytochrome P450